MSGMNFLERLLDGVAVEWKALGDISLKISSGGTPQTGVSEYYGGDIPWLRTQEVNFGDIWDTGVKITKAGLNNSSANWIPENCVIVAMYGATVGKIGINKIPMTTNQACANIQLDASVANYRYIFHFLLSQYEYIKSLGAGSQTNINAGIVRKLQIPIPCPDNPDRSLAIQAEIVRILDTFTELTAELTAELSDRKKQYNYYRDRLLTFEDGEVEWKTLGEITRIFSASRVHKNEWTTSGIPFYRTSDVISIFNGVKNSRDAAFISNELYETLSSKSGKIQKNDILVTGGGTIGIPYIVPTDEPLYFKDADLLCIKKSKTLNSKFLYHYFLTTKFRIYLENISHNSTIAHYTISQITKTPVPVPPLEEQARIVAILDKFDTLTHSISEGLPREIALRQKQYEYYRDLLLSFPPPLTPP